MSKVDDLDAGMVLAAAAATEREARMVELRRLELAVQWCVLHPATEETGVATHNPDTTLPGVLGLDESLGGDGTPAVAAFTPEPFAAAMGMSPAAGARLLADALDLTHRLPLLWPRVQTLRCRRGRPAGPPNTPTNSHWKGRGGSTTGSPTTPAAVRSRADRLVADAIARFDPEEHARREDQGKASWDVELVHPAPTEYAGISELHARGDTLDLTKFYDLVCDTAPGPRPRRVGPLVPPLGGYYQPLGLTAARRLRALLDLAESAHVRLSLPSRQQRRLGSAACWMRPAPATLAKIKEWVGHAQVTIQPVLDLGRGDAVDRHDPPAWMREIVILRDRHCVFPGCRVDARACDQDHLDPYLDPGDGGPPGQTSPANLACLCRRHHRAKTAGLWRYHRAPNRDGYLWHGPHGKAYLVTPTGAITLPGN